MSVEILWHSQSNEVLSSAVSLPITHFLLCWGLMTHQPLWVVLHRLPEKRRNEIEEMKEETGRKRNKNEWEETEEIKTFPLYFYLLQG